MIPAKVLLKIPQSTLQMWQESVDILAAIIGIPACLIMRLNDPFIEVLISSKSEGNPYHPGDKEHWQKSGLYCETAIKTDTKLLVPDALADDHWKNNPDIKLKMISYLGFPIHLPDGEAFGTICVLDNKANRYSENFEKLILILRSLIESEIATVYMNQILGDENKRLTDYLQELQLLRGVVPICSYCKSICDEKHQWHPIEHYLIKSPTTDFSHGICPACMKKHHPKRAAN